LKTHTNTIYNETKCCIFDLTNNVLLFYR